VGSGLAAMERTIDHVAVRCGPGQRSRFRFIQPRRFQLLGLRQGLQAEEQFKKSSEMGMWQGTPVPMSPLRLQGEAEDAYRATHGANAQRENL